MPDARSVPAGAALWYSDVLKGAPPTLERQITRFPALHEVNVVFTVRYVPVPVVLDEERFLVKSLPIPGFFHVIARSGPFPSGPRTYHRWRNPRGMCGSSWVYFTPAVCSTPSRAFLQGSWHVLCNLMLW